MSSQGTVSLVALWDNPIKPPLVYTLISDLVYPQMLLGGKTPTSQTHVSMSEKTPKITFGLLCLAHTEYSQKAFVGLFILCGPVGVAE